jgi:IS30 family transposase
MNNYKRLDFKDREEISRGIWAKESFASIARRISRSTSTVSREVWRNNFYKWQYFASKAQDRSNSIKIKGRRPKKLDINEELRKYVYDKLQNYQ